MTLRLIQSGHWLKSLLDRPQSRLGLFGQTSRMWLPSLPIEKPARQHKAGYSFSSGI